MRFMTTSPSLQPPARRLAAHQHFLFDLKYEHREPMMIYYQLRPEARTRTRSPAA
jgi:hypothetical protein